MLSVVLKTQPVKTPHLKLVNLSSIDAILFKSNLFPLLHSSHSLLLHPPPRILKRVSSPWQTNTYPSENCIYLSYTSAISSSSHLEIEPLQMSSCITSTLIKQSNYLSPTFMTESKLPPSKKESNYKSQGVYQCWPQNGLYENFILFGAFIWP